MFPGLMSRWTMPFSCASCEPLSHLDRDGERLIDRERPPVDPLLEALPLDELHRDEGLPLVLVDLVYRADIGMVERGGGLRLVHEAGLGLLVAGELGMEELEGDGAIELRVLGLVHDAHPALAELLEDPVMGDRFADHGDPPARDHFTGSTSAAVP